MSLAQFSRPDLLGALRAGRFRLDIGAFTVKIVSAIPEFAHALTQLYAPYPASITGGPYDYDIDIAPASFPRHWFRRNALFRISGEAPFLPMDVKHAHALFEWGLNWTIGSYAHHYLILHSAVVEHRGRGVLLAAMSGSGKSTLSGELALRGWRLLSDEMALIDERLQFAPCARPVSLKNESIRVLQSRHPGVALGPPAHDTHKGTIAHLPAPAASVARNRERAAPGLIVFPKWSANASLRIERIPSGQAAMRLIDQSFNYAVLGEAGFHRLADLVATCNAWSLEYSSLDDAVGALERLLDDFDEIG